MQRREFLHLSLSMLLASTIGFDKLKNALTPHKLNEISKYLVMGYHTNTIECDLFGEKTISTNGYGVILGNYYLTLNHIAKQYSITVPSPFGPQRIDVILKSSTHHLDQEMTNKLEEVYCSTKDDIAIFKLTKPDDRKWKFGFNTGELKYKDVVYLIGNPKLNGINIREAKVSDMDGIIIEKLGVSCGDNFGVDSVVIPGDSGTPVVDADFKLVGFSQAVLYGSLGYVKKIKPFIDIIKKENLKKVA